MHTPVTLAKSRSYVGIAKKGALRKRFRLVDDGAYRRSTSFARAAALSSCELNVQVCVNFWLDIENSLCISTQFLDGCILQARDARRRTFLKRKT